MKLENSKEALHKAQEASTSKKNDQREKVEKKKGNEKSKANEKQGNNPKMPRSGITNHKAPLPMSINYLALNAPTRSYRCNIGQEFVHETG